MTIASASGEPDGQGELLLVRHTQVASRFEGICYGASDVELSPDGEAHAQTLAGTLAQENPDVIFHSGLVRAKYLAQRVGQLTGRDICKDARLMEMNFGAWELRAWDDIFGDVGHDMSRLVHEPDTYCAPGGETTSSVCERMMDFVSHLPRAQTVLAVGHGGAICTLRGALAGAPSASWPDFIPAFGDVVRIRLPI